jgi:hypothetical protein
MIAKHARYLIQAGRDAAVLSRTFPFPPSAHLNPEKTEPKDLGTAILFHSVYQE